MSDELHPSHRWGERAFWGEMQPACLDCRVWGFEDEPRAFTECPGPPETPEKKEKGAPCWATYESAYMPGHTHLCEIDEHTGHHVCAECGRFFGTQR
jgi:hypothetical protein